MVQVRACWSSGPEPGRSPRAQEFSSRFRSEAVPGLRAAVRGSGSREPWKISESSVWRNHGTDVGLFYTTSCVKRFGLLVASVVCRAAVPDLDSLIPGLLLGS